MTFITQYEYELELLQEAKKAGSPNLLSPAVIGGAGGAAHELYKQKAFGEKRAWGGIGPKRGVIERFAHTEHPSDTKKKVERAAMFRRWGNKLRRYRGIPEKDDINIGAETIRRVQDNYGSALAGSRPGWEETKRKATTGAVIGGTTGGAMDFLLRR